MNTKSFDPAAEAALPLLKEPVRIIIIKSDYIYVECLCLICRKVFLNAQIKIHTTAGDALECLNSDAYDYCIMGLRFHDWDGVNLLQEISQKRLAKNLIVVAEEQDKPILPSLHTTRLDAIIDTFHESHITMRAALRLVSKGQVYISPTLRSYLVERHSSLTLRQSLTAGELRVLRCIGIGHDNEEASKVLGISVGTVQTHRRSIMRKFNVSSSTKLVFEAIRLGFVQTNLLVTAGNPSPDKVESNIGPD
jgi:DNA-binding NarL/FixJ family response regulator